MKKICKNCLFIHSEQPFCTLGIGNIDPANDCCPKFLAKDAIVGKCSICGGTVYTGYEVFDLLEGDNFRILHRECAKKLGTCQTCVLANACEFDTNPDPMPKVVMQTIRQGNMTMQTQVRNPSRVEKFCNSCSCFSQENGCLKQNGCCGNWKE